MRQGRPGVKEGKGASRSVTDPDSGGHRARRGLTFGQHILLPIPIHTYLSNSIRFVSTPSGVDSR